MVVAEGLVGSFRPRAIQPRSGASEYSGFCSDSTVPNPTICRRGLVGCRGIRKLDHFPPEMERLAVVGIFRGKNRGLQDCLERLHFSVLDRLLQFRFQQQVRREFWARGEGLNLGFGAVVWEL